MNDWRANVEEMEKFVMTGNLDQVNSIMDMGNSSKSKSFLIETEDREGQSTQQGHFQMQTIEHIFLCMCLQGYPELF